MLKIIKKFFSKKKEKEKVVYIKHKMKRNKTILFKCYKKLWIAFINTIIGEIGKFEMLKILIYKEFDMSNNIDAVKVNGYVLDEDKKASVQDVIEDDGNIKHSVVYREMDFLLTDWQVYKISILVNKGDIDKDVIYFYITPNGRKLVIKDDLGKSVTVNIGLNYEKFNGIRKWSDPKWSDQK